MKRSALDQLDRPEFFFWATGIEDTFITAPWPATGRTLDEYELTQHYRFWREDIELIKSLGVSHARYGIPWHRINPERNAWHWEFADQTLNRLLELGIEPIVDLIHYGLPPWVEGSWLNKDLPQYMAEYAFRTADRFRGRIHMWTPLNEPRVTAWYCGKLGWWPPGLRGWTGFNKVLLAVAKCVVATSRALADADSENVAVPVDATDLYESPDPDLAAEVEHRQELVFLALDLVSGRVTPEHRLYAWLLQHGATETDLELLSSQALDLELIGINLYPLFSHKVLTRGPRLRMRMPYATADIVLRLAEMYHRRYGKPLFIAETASLGSVERRAKWLDDSVAAVRKVRAAGLPLVGYTWWPLFALVTWAYRQGRHAPAYYLKQMGLWNLALDEQGALVREPTALVEQFRKMVGTPLVPIDADGRLLPSGDYPHV